MKKLMIILVFMAVLMSCEKTEIYQEIYPEPENTLFLYDLISKFRNEVDYRFLDNNYTQYNGMFYYSRTTGIRASTYYGDLGLLNKVIYIINDSVDMNDVLAELNENLTIENDTLWIESIAYPDISSPYMHQDTNLWVLLPDTEIDSDKFVLTAYKKQ